MWLADAVAAYVERLTEREFDAPFIALLHHLGFTDVHLTHGQFEFGKDFIARRVEGDVEEQWCFQSKAGNIKSGDLRADVRPQVDLMRAGSVVHPAFDKKLPRRIVVVTTGRLVGGASIEFQEFEQYKRDNGEVGAELWDIDTLVPDLVSTLVTDNDLGTQARLLEMVGRLQGRRGSRSDIGSLASGWLPPGASDKSSWRDVLSACLLANAAAQAAREDLAQQVAWQLVRAFYRAVERGDAPDPAILEVAGLAFDQIATEFWNEIRAVENPVRVTMQSVNAAAAFLTHPIKVARLCETLSMLALARLADGDHAGADELLTFIESVVAETPALGHLVGEEWAFSVLVTVLALAAGGRYESAVAIVRGAMVWLLDLVEDGTLLPRVGASPVEVVERMLAQAYKPPAAVGTRAGYTFGVLTDLAALLADVTQSDDVEGLYVDFVHDLDAFRAMASVTVPTGVETGKHVARVEYRERAPRANHHDACADEWPVESWLDSLKIWGTFRDRHRFGVLAAAVSAAT